MRGDSHRGRVPAVMIQGTGSNVGKSTLVAGLCRIFSQRGLRVLPFKPQNMSNNAAVTADGGEIGRAQALQARAARVPASVHMNPVLLKPESDKGAQIIVQGKRFGTLQARNFGQKRESLMPYVLDSFRKLEAEADLILVEGAGSPAEINLRQGDIANMGFALAANVPVILAGDIDRGGVIASIVGTHAVLNDDERGQIQAYLINRFRGDVSLFDDGLVAITERTGWPSLGVVPWVPAALRLPAEDAVDLERSGTTGGKKLTVVVPIIARIANFDDLDPLGQEEDVSLQFVRPGEPLPAHADLVILPGSKATIADLAFFRQQGWDIDLAAHIRRKGRVLGICGGYQMLGRLISDPHGIEGPPGEVAGLGYLDIETVLSDTKVTLVAEGRYARNQIALNGYEIHMGETRGADCARPFMQINGRDDGARSADGLIEGTYMHGLFSSNAFRAAFLAEFGFQAKLAYEAGIEAALDELAHQLETVLDVDAILAIARSRL